jgi:hypothetical protein
MLIMQSTGKWAKLYVLIVGDGTGSDTRWRELKVGGIKIRIYDHRLNPQ